jgi:hypothetical protein
MCSQAEHFHSHTGRLLSSCFGLLAKLPFFLIGLKPATINGNFLTIRRNKLECNSSASLLKAQAKLA